MLGCKVTRLAILAVFVLSAVLGAQEKPLRESGKAGATGDTKSKEAAGESKDAGNESSRPLESDQPAAETKSDQAPRRVAPAAPRDPFRPFTTSARASARRR
ncbi:MAG TPA: hypothetical protein VNO43_06030, partial [Candidatus Eisenbacteria bacterium]|nr:hypothetical protein [Candidatus Eisenbacteria bacterium]